MIKVPLIVRRFSCSESLERAFAYVRTAMLHHSGLAETAAALAAKAAMDKDIAAALALQRIWTHAMGVKFFFFASEDLLVL